MNESIYTSGSPENSCFCVGPNPGQPACPCRMRRIEEVALKMNVSVDEAAKALRGQQILLEE